MIKQTIALFRYQLLGIINVKIVLLILIIYTASFLAGQFVGELAIINSETLALAIMADFLRYSMVLIVVISLCNQISQDYELSQFERLLAMPISRGQYVVAQNMVILTFVLMLVLPLFVLMLLLNDSTLAVYWSIAVFLELALVGQFAVLAILSLEKLPVAVIFTLSIYLLAKLTPLLDLIFTNSMDYYQQERSFKLTHMIFSTIQYVLPDASAFAQNNVLFNAQETLKLLSKQLVSVLVYAAFIQFVILIDFYRKEFNRT